MYYKVTVVFEHELGFFPVINVPGVFRSVKITLDLDLDLNLDSEKTREQALK